MGVDTLTHSLTHSHTTTCRGGGAGKREGWEEITHVYACPLCATAKALCARPLWVGAGVGHDVYGGERRNLERSKHTTRDIQTRRQKGLMGRQRGVLEGSDVPINPWPPHRPPHPTPTPAPPAPSSFTLTEGWWKSGWTTLTSDSYSSTIKS